MMQMTPPPLPETTNRVIDQEILDGYIKTKNWVYFLSILGFVCAGLLFIMIVPMSLIAQLNPVAAPDQKQITLLVSGFYLSLAIATFFPSFFLFRYGNAISQLVRIPGNESLITVVNRQRFFFKFCALFVSGWIGFFILTIVTVAFVSAMSASHL